MNQELLKALSIKRGHFQYESGHHGDLWLEMDLLFLNPKLLQSSINVLAERLSDYKPDGICGALVGGALIAYMLADKLAAEFYYTEPEKTSQPESENLYRVNYRLPKNLAKQIYGKKIIIVDDVINAGSAVRATYTELNTHGASLIAIGCLVMLGTSAQDFFLEKQTPIINVETLSNKLWTPIECPLCHSKIPLGEIPA